MAPLQDPGFILSFEPWIRPYLKSLLTQGSKISLTDQPIQIIEPLSRLPVLADGDRNVRCDRFKVRIPYAEQTLTWEFLFDMSNMKEPPDVIFDPEDSDFHPPLENINSFVCWDWSHRESLVALISELLEFYKEYQLDRAGQNITLQRHIHSLLQESPKFQIIVNKSEKGIGMTNILIQSSVDFSGLPPYLIPSNPGPSSAVLQVCIPYPESTSIQTQLYLSPTVEHALGNSANLRIPVFKPGILLGEYYVNVNHLLQKQVSVLSESFDRRQDYVASFLSYFGRSVLEFDAENFCKVVLLLEWNDFFFTFTVDLPRYFPTEQPIFTFKSVYHNQNGKPYAEKHADFPYSPRWTGTEMAKRASLYILDVIKSFQMASVNNSDK